MMDGVLMSMVWLVGTIVSFALGAVLFLIAGVWAAIACRWLLSRRTGTPLGNAATALLAPFPALGAWACG
jgi:hypothetical protein